MTGLGPAFDERRVLVKEHDQDARHVGGFAHPVDERFQVSHVRRVQRPGCSARYVSRTSRRGRWAYSFKSWRREGPTSSRVHLRISGGDDVGHHPRRDRDPVRLDRPGELVEEEASCPVPVVADGEIIDRAPQDRHGQAPEKFVVRPYRDREPQDRHGRASSSRFLLTGMTA